MNDQKFQFNSRYGKICFIAITAFFLSCANSNPSVVGGWYDNNSNYACFRADHRVGFGDDPAETLTPKSTWSDDGRINFSTGLKGSWKILYDGSLEVFIENCTADCAVNPVKFQRNNSFGCPE